MRDLIGVERPEGTDDAPGSLAELARVADELLPPLVARLGVSELGEIEVREGTWRVRIRRAVAAANVPTPAAYPSTPAAHSTHSATGTTGLTGGGSGATGAPHALPTSASTDHPVATSTAVGYFAARPGLAVGHSVSRGDVVGWVDVLGVRVEIVAPTDGVIERFLIEPGDPVEYGQELVSLMAATGPGAPAATSVVSDTDSQGDPV